MAQLLKQKQILSGKQKETLIDELRNAFGKHRLRNEMKNLTLFCGFLTAAVAGRIALQWIPSVEPIIPFAVLAGLVLGLKEGFLLGGSAYVISNFFVWGLQGPWTIFQALGGALAGAGAGAYGKLRKPKPFDLVLLSVAGTLLFEVVMNLTGPIIGIGLFGLGIIPLYFLTSLPFSAIHIGSNAVFAKMLKPLLKFGGNKNEFKAISFSRAGGGKRSSIRMYKSE